MVIFMEYKVIKYGSHNINNDNDGYMYNFNTSKSYTFNLHTHKCYEFIHIIHGKFLYTVEGNDYMVSDGDFIMANPGEYHAFSFPDECEYQREFLHIYPGFFKEFPKVLENLDSRKKGYFNHFPKQLVEKYGIDKIFGGIENCCKEPYPETDFMVLTYSLQLATVITRILREETSEYKKVPLKNKKANSVCDYIDHHYKENITLEEIATLNFMSPSYASRMFKKETGMTIKAYLNLRRVTSAKNLIMEGQKATNIYCECGFLDYSTFYRSFLKFVGMTPDEFKHKNSQNRKNC